MRLKGLPQCIQPGLDCPEPQWQTDSTAVIEVLGHVRLALFELPFTCHKLSDDTCFQDLNQKMFFAQRECTLLLQCLFELWPRKLSPLIRAEQLLQEICGVCADFGGKSFWQHTIKAPLPVTLQQGLIGTDSAGTPCDMVAW